MEQCVHAFKIVNMSCSVNVFLRCQTCCYCKSKVSAAKDGGTVQDLARYVAMISNTTPMNAHHVSTRMSRLYPMPSLQYPKSQYPSPFVLQGTSHPGFLQLSRDTGLDSTSASPHMYESFAASSALAVTSLTKLESGSLRYDSMLPI
jgi:hypothetical protein